MLFDAASFIVISFVGIFQSNDEMPGFVFPVHWKNPNEIEF